MLHTFAVKVLKSTDDSEAILIGQLVGSLVGPVATNLGIHGDPESTKFVGGHSLIVAPYGQFGSSADGAVKPGAFAVCS